MLFLWGKSRLIDGLLCCDMAIWHGMVHCHQGPVIKGVPGVSRTVHSLHTHTSPPSESLHIFPSYPLQCELRRSDFWLQTNYFWCPICIFVEFHFQLVLNDYFRCDLLWEHLLNYTEGTKMSSSLDCLLQGLGLCRQCCFLGKYCSSVESIFPRKTYLTPGIYSCNKNFNELDARPIAIVCHCSGKTDICLF